MTFTVEFFEKMFVGLTIDPNQDENYDNLVYLYWEDEGDGGAVEEEKAQFVAIIGNVLHVKTFGTNDDGTEFSNDDFIPMNKIQSIRMVDPTLDIQEHWKNG